MTLSLCSCHSLQPRTRGRKSRALATLQMSGKLGRFPPDPRASSRGGGGSRGGGSGGSAGGGRASRRAATAVRQAIAVELLAFRSFRRSWKIGNRRIFFKILRYWDIGKFIILFCFCFLKILGYWERKNTKKEAKQYSSTIHRADAPILIIFQIILATDLLHDLVG